MHLFLRYNWSIFSIEIYIYFIYIWYIYIKIVEDICENSTRKLWMKFLRRCWTEAPVDGYAGSLEISKSRVGQEHQWFWEWGGGLQEKQNGIDRLSEMLKCLTENYIRKKRKRLINSDLKWTRSGSNVGYRCANACVCRMWVHVCFTHVDEEGHRCRCAYGSLGHRREKRGQRKKEEIMLYSEVLIKISGFFMEMSLRWFVYFSVCCKVRGHC